LSAASKDTKFTGGVPDLGNDGISGLASATAPALPAAADAALAAIRREYAQIVATIPIPDSALFSLANRFRQLEDWAGSRKKRGKALKAMDEIRKIHVKLWEIAKLHAEGGEIRRRRIESDEGDVQRIIDILDMV